MCPSLSSSGKVLLICCFAILAVSSALGQVTGAVFTSEPVTAVPCSPSTCTPDLSSGAVFTVNSNLYPAKVDVFLNGGPKNDTHGGLTPTAPAPGVKYYFQVTDPNGSVLLSADPAACRVVDVVTDAAGNGRVDGLDASVLSNPSCPSRVVLPDPASGTTANPVQMCPPAPGRPDTLGNGAPLYDPNNWCDNTPNPGGEYKAFLIRADHATVAADGLHLIFGNQDSQTDNFKVQNSTSAFIEVCKFNDNGAGTGGIAGDGIQNGTEPLIPHWPINATGVDTGSGIGTVNTQTSDDGCVEPPFSVSTFTDGSATVTLTENVLSGWTETAPLNGSYDLNANSGCTTNCATSVAGFTETITVTPGETVVAPNFGNELTGSQELTLTVTKTATPSLTRTFKWSISKGATGDTTLNSIPTVFSAGGGTSDAASYTVDVSHDSGTDSGWQVSGKITVSNNTGTDITGIDISDADTANGNCVVQPAADGTPITDATISANTHEDFPYTCAYSAAPAAGTNTNTATATPEQSSNAQGGPFIGTATWDFSTASINIVDGGVTVTDTFGGTLGTVTINSDGSITVTGGVVDGTNPAQADFTYTHTFSGDTAGSCTSHQNTATFTTNDTGTTGTAQATVQDCQGADLTVTKTATPTFTFGIVKTPNQATTIDSSGGSTTLNYTVTVTESGWQVSGDIYITNPNNWKAVSVTVSDSFTLTGGNCTSGGSTFPLTSVSVPASAVKYDVPYTCTFSSAPAAASGTNTAGISWDSGAAHTPDNSASSGAVGFTFASLTVTDAFNGATVPCSTTVTTNCVKTLGTISTPAASTPFNDSYMVTPTAGTCTTYPNTATVTDDTTTHTSGASEKICVGADLVVTKTATAAFTSGVSKSVNQTKVEQSGGNITFNYTVTVTESAWTVTGNIYVKNPNDWESITASVGDALTDTGGNCVVTGGSSVPVGASSTATLSYSCTFAARPSSVSGTNTATATWNSAAAFTPDSSTKGTAGYTFNTLTITDNVQDSSYPSGCTATLGTVTVVATGTTVSTTPGCGITNLKVGSTWGTFTYSITDANASPGMCTSYNNTAQITGGSSSNPVTVTGCNTNTGALTMGFWKNTNGQKLITGANQTNLAAFLTSYNPFKDYPQKSGQSIASYVSTVIGGATCSSGGTCNAMLKAQMLATALDVFFSNPANGDTIKAYNGGITVYLGNVNIDLSHSCAMVDGSTSSSCSGTFEDARPEFGINPASTTPACLGTSVLNMLEYANYLSSVNGSPNGSAVSNNGGSDWYNQVKTPKQVFAKDSFDSTNNQTANIATQSCSPSF